MKNRGEIITPEQFYEKMKEIRKQYKNDEECAHGEMDDLMAETLISLGYKRGIAIFEKQTKWYS